MFSDADRSRRAEVMGRVLEFVRSDRAIKLPAFDPEATVAAAPYALQSIEPNDFSGTAGPFRYQLEGEEDLLHLIVMRRDGGSLSPEEGQAVAGFVLQGLPSALIWLRPGTFGQHFYFGHDELLDSLVL